jgi:tRNA 5-methylaminomethyl-2-thiouridine biosynthesis bifunctional protein
MVQSAIIDWDADGAPRSRQFDDIYYSKANGLQETRIVYLQGCGLPERFASRNRFVVGELGFGTGLNVLALLQMWSRVRAPDARLHVFSVEAYPLPGDAAARALGAWSELAPLAERLLRNWPEARGFHRIDFPELNAILDVAVMEAAEGLRAWDGQADAWFLDGFAPAKNPEMWREEVLELVAERSAAGARLASFSVAGAVRRGLQGAGFDVEKRPGFGAKGQRLEAVLAPGGGASPGTRAKGRVCIIGAGVAGASLSRAFLHAGARPTLVDVRGPGAGASGNPSALVTPRFDASGGFAAQLHAQAFARAARLYEAIPDAVLARGALQLEAGERDQTRFDRIAASDLFEAGALRRLGPEETGQRLGEDTDVGGLWIRDGLTIEPAAVLFAWLSGCPLITQPVEALEQAGGCWRLLGSEGRVLLEAETVCLAAGAGSAALWPNLQLSPVRGQATFAVSEERPTAAAWGGYLVRTRDGLLFGATHDRGDASAETRTQDDERNLSILAKARPGLASRIAGQALGARGSVRAATPDALPLAGALADGLYVLSGLGGRGFTLAPLLAEHIAAAALDAPSPLPSSLSATVRPDRFSARSARRTNARARLVTA